MKGLPYKIVVRIKCRKEKSKELNNSVVTQVVYPVRNLLEIVPSIPTLGQVLKKYLWLWLSLSQTLDILFTDIWATKFHVCQWLLDFVTQKHF